MKRGLVLLFVTIVAATYEVNEEDICCLPKETGTCKASMPRWYYNVENGACERFTYGGCGANENNFLTKCDCHECCGDDTIHKNICCQPKEIGPCRASISRWFYNCKSDACEEFTYGGCEGNQNNFQEKCECEQKCL